MKTALVTGATSGVGRPIAEALAASGRRVLAVGRDQSRLAEVAATANIVPVDIDIRDRDGLERRLDELAKASPLGRGGEPREMAEWVLMAAGPRNTYMTGESIIISGGYIYA